MYWHGADLCQHESAHLWRHVHRDQHDSDRPAPRVRLGRVLERRPGAERRRLLQPDDIQGRVRQRQLARWLVVLQPAQPPGLCQCQLHLPHGRGRIGPGLTRLPAQMGRRLPDRHLGHGCGRGRRIRFRTCACVRQVRSNRPPSGCQSDRSDEDVWCAGDADGHRSARKRTHAPLRRAHTHPRASDPGLNPDAPTRSVSRLSQRLAR
jgi:hypothetical protein